MNQPDLGGESYLYHSIIVILLSYKYINRRARLKQSLITSFRGPLR
jgi:hypothetical protein